MAKSSSAMSVSNLFGIWDFEFSVAMKQVARRQLGTLHAQHSTPQPQRDLPTPDLPADRQAGGIGVRGLRDLRGGTPEQSGRPTHAPWPIRVPERARQGGRLTRRSLSPRRSSGVVAWSPVEDPPWRDQATHPDRRSPPKFDATTAPWRRDARREGSRSAWPGGPAKGSTPNGTSQRDPFGTFGAVEGSCGPVCVSAQAGWNK